MANKFMIINPLTYPGWDDLLLSHEGYSFFHTSSWAQVLSDSYGYEPLTFALIDGDQLLAMIPVMAVKSIFTGYRGVSLPFSDYSRPLAGDQGQFDEIMGLIIDYGRRVGWKYFEIRGGEDYCGELSPYDSYYCHTLDLSRSEQEIFAGLRNETRRSIKKAENGLLTISLGTSMKHLDAFYRLNCLTRKRHGVPPQPYGFFRNIHEHVLARDKGFVMLGSCDGSFVAGAVYFHFGKRAMYKFGASDSTVEQPGINKLIMWKAIEFLCQNGYESLCFGRTDQHNDGLRFYKTGWGTREEVIRYFRIDMASGFALGHGTAAFGVAREICRYLPATVSRMIGSALYKHIA